MSDLNINKNHPDEENILKENIEVWEDLVNIKSLVLSLCICSIAALGGYFIAPNDPPKPLFFGLSGALLGFIVCSILVKPKRTILEVQREE
jgi:membrane associated rhomboid family serine protease